MNELLEKEDVKIENMIYEVRGKQVMLAKDVAFLYRSETRTINQVVKRNINRFPKEFCFQLTVDEWINLRSQFVISKEDRNLTMHHGGIRHIPYAFTEQGIMMLSGLLKSDVAVEINVAIINAFVTMRKYMSDDLLEQKYFNKLVLKHEEDIQLLKSTFKDLKENNSEIYFNGQIYDAYSKIIEIMNKAKEEVIIIDSYADNKVLDMISKVKVNVLLVTRKNNLLKQIDIDKYKKQYVNLAIIYNNTFHDRYLILDRKLAYHSGSSLNHIGEKTFSINKLEDKNIVDSLLNVIL